MSNAMKVPVSNRWKAWIIVLLLPLLGGCSAVRLSYGQGPLLAYWWLDSQVAFTAEQAPQVRSALVDWFTWHRSTQLPDYAQALGELAAAAAGPVSPGQVCQQIEAWQRRAERAVDRAVPAAAEQVRSMTLEQIQHIERRQADRQKELVADHQQADLAERQKAALARSVDRFESIYGSLDDAQRQLLAAALATSPFDAERWLTERRLRTAEVLRSLRQWQAEQADSATVQAGLRRLAAETLRSPRADYRAYSQRLLTANCNLVAQLHNSTSAAQRQRAAAKLQGWQADLRALADSR
ncbi:hypothetical protein AQPW35_30340 [Rubrivivax pictus]|uniref:Lipoprotein n=1 Tax=Pseudaquabacterium pictum TaxID=2315236 RepID=A0A480AR81_9BURK|nr:hypothetical protein AQPW35_30340 [Rubrivivax pictus]